jgi:hypothetical protein
MEYPDDDPDRDWAEQENEEEDLLAALLGIARTALHRAEENLMLLAEGDSGSELDVSDIEFELEIPVGRADAVASAIAALDARWRLILGMIEQAQPGAPFRAIDVAGLLVSVDYGLMVVEADMGSVRLRLKPSKRSTQIFTTASAALAGAGGLAEASGTPPETLSMPLGEAESAASRSEERHLTPSSATTSTTSSGG